MGFPSKGKIVLTIKKDEAQAALAELVRECNDAETSLSTVLKRLLWFRQWQAYRHLGYSTFAAFLKGEMQRSRQWFWEHLKTLPIVETERRLLGLDPGNTHLTAISKKTHLDAENNGDGKMGSFLGRDLKLTRRQHLEVAKLEMQDQDKAINALLKECPGGDLKATREVIEKTVQHKPKPKPAAKRKVEDVDHGEVYREIMLQLGKQFTAQAGLRDAAIAKTGTSVIGDAIQTLRKLGKTISGWEPRKTEAPF